MTTTTNGKKTKPATLELDQTSKANGELTFDTAEVSIVYRREDGKWEPWIVRKITTRRIYVSSLAPLWELFEGEFVFPKFNMIWIGRRLLEKNGINGNVAVRPTPEAAKAIDTKLFEKELRKAQARIEKCGVGYSTRREQAIVSAANLGITPPVTAEKLKTAYRELAAKHHPDHAGNAREFANVEEHFRVAMERYGRTGW